MSNKIYKNVKEMVKDHEQERKKLLDEMIKTDVELKKEKKKKFIKLIIFSLSIFSLFKIFIGEINLYLPIYYNHRLYDVTLNEKLISVCVDEYRKTPIIPFMINNNYTELYCFHQDAEGMTTRVFYKGDKIHITINSFECFNSINNAKTSCYLNKNQRKEETKDTKYSLLIQRAGGAEKVIYDGDFVNNITDYFSEEGVYSVSMIAKYDNVKSIVSFSIRIVD
jgi:hypothetical protein